MENLGVTNLGPLLNTDSSQVMEEKFVYLLKQVQLFLFDFGVEKHLFSTYFKPLEKFNSLDVPVRNQIIENLENYRKALSELKEYEDPAQKNTLNLFWLFMRELGFRSTSDLFSHLSQTDVLEIYNSTGVQIFCSMNFFNLSSYSLEEIFSYSWFDLYKREKPITQELINITVDASCGKISETYLLSIDPHDVTENHEGNVKYVTKINQKLIAPLYKIGGSSAGFIHAFEVLSHQKLNGAN